ncbi:MAG: ABC transporter permease [Candidatus Aminicenantes bacterium]|nr:ABC transporter permease [Candidatus Aminicenantes bacterium]
MESALEKKRREKKEWRLRLSSIRTEHRGWNMFWEFVKSSFFRFSSHKLVTFLAVLGISIASATFVATFAVGSNARAQILSDIQEMGVNLVFIRSIRIPTTRNPWESRLELNLDDMEFLRKNLKDIQYIVPQIVYDDVIRFGQERLLRHIEGTTSDCRFTQNLKIKVGRFLNTFDLDLYRHVCVLGTNLAEELFGQENPVGQTVFIGLDFFTVVGVLQSKPAAMNFDYNERAIIPITTLQRNRNLGKKIDTISISTFDPAQAPPLVKEISEKLTTHHGEKNFNVWCQEVFLQQRERIASVFQLLMISLALISLLVGGIGIMNIMLVSVRDRTKEIGIKRAVGATKRNILFQFLLEATMISMMGGIFGIIFGTLLGRGITGIMAFILDLSVQWSAIWSPTVFIFSFISVCVIGILSGFYPAYRASIIQPVEALRYE